MKESIKYKILYTGKLLISDKLFYKAANYYLHLRMGFLPRKLNIKIPKTFNEKIIYNKLYNRFENGHFLADKFEVRKYIKKIIGEEFLVPLLGIYDNEEKIDFTVLPKKFVIKITQGSGWNILIEDKNNTNFKEVKEKLKFWLKLDYSIYGREWQYNSTTSRIIIEEYLESSVDYPLHDYKFFCFNGTPCYIQLDVDRSSNHTRNFYDLNWKFQPFRLLYSNSKEIIERPKQLEEMISLSKKIAMELSTYMDFVRIDFYNCKGRIYFGEITFHPDGGSAPFMPRKYDNLLGQQLKMTQKDKYSILKNV